MLININMNYTLIFLFFLLCIFTYLVYDNYSSLFKKKIHEKFLDEENDNVNCSNKCGKIRGGNSLTLSMKKKKCQKKCGKKNKENIYNLIKNAGYNINYDRIDCLEKCKIEGHPTSKPYKKCVKKCTFENNKRKRVAMESVIVKYFSDQVKSSEDTEQENQFFPKITDSTNNKGDDSDNKSNCVLDPYIPKVEKKLDNEVEFSKTCLNGSEQECLPDEKAQHRLNIIDYYFKESLKHCSRSDSPDYDVFEIKDANFSLNAASNNYEWMTGPQNCLSRLELNTLIDELNEEVIYDLEYEKNERNQLHLNCRNAYYEGILKIKNSDNSWNDTYKECVKGNIDLDKRRRMAEKCVKASNSLRLNLNNEDLQKCIDDKNNLINKLHIVDKCEYATKKDLLNKRTKNNRSLHTDFKDCINGKLDVDELLKKSKVCHDAVKKNILQKYYKIGIGKDSKIKKTKYWKECLNGKISEERINQLKQEKLNRRKILCNLGVKSYLIIPGSENHNRCIKGQSFKSTYQPPQPEKKVNPTPNRLNKTIYIPQPKYKKDIYGFRKIDDNCPSDKKVYKYKKNVLPIYYFDINKFKWELTYL